MAFPAVDGVTRGRINLGGDHVLELGYTQTSEDVTVPQSPSTNYNLDLIHATDITIPAAGGFLEFDADFTFNAGGDTGEWKAQVFVDGNLEWERFVVPGENISLKPQLDLTAYAGTTVPLTFRLTRDFGGAETTLALTVENVGGALVDYPVMVDRPELAGREVEFYSDSDLTVAMDWWREDANTWWVKIPSIGADSTQVIYAKYGGATIGGDGNGFNVFPFFDDFAGGSLHAQWDNTNGTPTQVGGILTLDPGDGIFASGYTLPHSVVMQSRARRQISSGNGKMVNAAINTTWAFTQGSTGNNQCGIGSNGAQPEMHYSTGSLSMGTPSLPTASWIKSVVRYRPGNVDSSRYRFDDTEALGNNWNNKKQNLQVAADSLFPTLYWHLTGYCEYDHYFIRPDSPNGIAVRPPDPVAYWSFDDADISGGQVLDRMGNGLHLDIIGGVTTGVAGQVNQACLTDGSTGYFQHPGDPLLSFDDADDEWSIECWVKSANNHAIASTHFYLLKPGHLHQASGGYIYNGLFNWNETSNRYIRSELPNTVNDNNWHHVVITKGLDESVSAMEIYIDGVLDLKAYLSDGDPGDNLQWVKPFTIGALEYLGQPNDISISAAATYDEMRVFRSKLNEQHVRWLYQAGVNGIQPW